jgi:tetratricopeptide (TPR) repeat protein
MNGVPLCGNCHVEIKGDELAHVDDLQRLQRAILGGEAAGATSNTPNETELRERACAEPSNAEAVKAWFEVADAKAVTDFYDQHREHSTKTELLCLLVGSPLYEMRRWQDLIAVADKWMEISEREGTLEESVGRIGGLKSDALNFLGRQPEAVAFCRELVARFPEVASLHCDLSFSLFRVFGRAGENIERLARVAGIPAREIRKAVSETEVREERDAIEESARHASRAAELAPNDFRLVLHASCVLRFRGDYASALRYGKRALALASSDEEKIHALCTIAYVYKHSDLYADARSYLREALEIDDCNVDAIADIAHCFYMEHNEREAVRMAKRALLLDPQNKNCQDIVRCVGRCD